MEHIALCRSLAALIMVMIVWFIWSHSRFRLMQRPVAQIVLHCCFLGFTAETCTAYVRDRFISFGEESASFGLKAEFWDGHCLWHFMTILLDSQREEESLDKSIAGPSWILRLLLASPLVAGKRNGEVGHAGQTTGGQKLLGSHLQRDRSPPQHSGSNCNVRQMDCAPSWLSTHAHMHSQLIWCWTFNVK